jgi:hypothetical protein
MRARRCCSRWARTGCGGLRTCRSRRRDDARRMSDFEIDDRQKHAQGAASYTDALPPSVRGSGRRSASASRRLIPYGADFRRQGSGARWRAACRSAASVGYSGPIGLDRRDHEGRSIAQRGNLVSRGVSRVALVISVPRQPRSGISAVISVPRQPRSGISAITATTREDLSRSAASSLVAECPVWRSLSRCLGNPGRGSPRGRRAVPLDPQQQVHPHGQDRPDDDHAPDGLLAAGVPRCGRLHGAREGFARLHVGRADIAG